MGQKRYFNIGEFARLSGISRKNLIFYDKIGLYCPQKVGENGYRYYSHHQLDGVAVIYSLRELGMSLKEIKVYLDERTPERLTTLFTEQKKVLEREVGKLRKIDDMIQARLAMTKEGATADVDHISIKEQEQEKLMVSALITAKSENPLWDNILLDFYDDCARQGVSNSYPVGAIVPLKNLEQKEWRLRSHYFVKPGPKDVLSQTMWKPAGMYAVGYMLGDYDEVEPLYTRMDAFIRENGWMICGDAYEEALLDEIAVRQPEQYLSRISIQVKKCQNAIIS